MIIIINNQEVTVDEQEAYGSSYTYQSEEERETGEIRAENIRLDQNRELYLSCL